MAERSVLPRLADIIEAIERIHEIMDGLSLEIFEADWQKQWRVVRGIEIIPEASRHLPDDLKARYPSIPWRKVADIGNILRHDYGNVAAPIIWKLVRMDLDILQHACRDEIKLYK